MVDIPYVTTIWADRVIPALPRVITILIGAAIMLFFYSLVTQIVKRFLLAKAKTKAEKHNAVVVMSIWKYFFMFFMILALIFLATGSLTGLGISAGLLTAALGWALQRPITGIAGWIMIVTRKPFQIGDRILIGNVKGDVSDITLTHVYLREIGGTIATEENSGRIVMVPNSVLFEKNIINYTLQDDFVLDQVSTLVTFNSNVDKAINIALDSAKKITKQWRKEVPDIQTRTYFKESGVRVVVRYFTKADIMTQVSSDITYEILKAVKKTKSVDIAYPHMRVLLGKKK